MNHRELLRDVRKRPGMYVGYGDLDFDRLVAFLVGLDIGTSNRLLDGFREYLILRLGEESSVWWPGLAIKASAPHALPRPRNRDAVDGTLQLFDEFLAEFPEERSRSRLHHEYILWVQQLSFFDVDLERFGRFPRPDMIGVDDATDILDVTRAAVFDLIAAGPAQGLPIWCRVAAMSRPRHRAARPEQRLAMSAGSRPWLPMHHRTERRIGLGGGG